METQKLLELFRKAPIPKSMGADMTFSDDGAAIVTMPVRREHLQATGVAHGAVLTFAADTSAWFTAAEASPSPITTSGFNLSLLRSVKEGDTLRAESSVVKAGKTLVVVRTQVTRGDGALVAEGTFTHTVVAG